MEDRRINGAGLKKKKKKKKKKKGFPFPFLNVLKKRRLVDRLLTKQSLRCSPALDLTFAAVSDLRRDVLKDPVDADWLGLLGLAGRIIHGDAAESRMINIEVGGQVGCHVLASLLQPTAHGTGEVPMVVHVTCAKSHGLVTCKLVLFFSIFVFHHAKVAYVIYVLHQRCK